MIDAFRLHPHPQLELVRRDRDVIAGHVGGGVGVHAGAAFPRVNEAELVLDQDGALGGHEFVEALVQLLPVRRLVLRFHQVVNFAPAIGGAHFGLLDPHLVADLLLFGQDFLVLLVILRADGLRSLEHHVLEEMGGAGDAGSLVGRAHVRDPAARDRRRIVALDHQQLHPVGERDFGHRHLLRPHGHRPRQERERDGGQNPARENKISRRALFHFSASVQLGQKVCKPRSRATQKVPWRFQCGLLSRFRAHWIRWRCRNSNYFTPFSVRFSPFWSVLVCFFDALRAGVGGGRTYRYGPEWTGVRRNAPEGREHRSPWPGWVSGDAKDDVPATFQQNRNGSRNPLTASSDLFLRPSPAPAGEARRAMFPFPFILGTIMAEGPEISKALEAFYVIFLRFGETRNWLIALELMVDGRRGERQNH